MRNINKSFPVFATIQNVEDETSLQLFDILSQINVELKYAGIEIPPYFVIGYGLDYDEEGRNLSNIYIIDYED